MLLIGYLFATYLLLDAAEAPLGRVAMHAIRMLLDAT